MAKLEIQFKNELNIDIKNIDMKEASKLLKTIENAISKNKKMIKLQDTSRPHSLIIIDSIQWVRITED